MLTSESFSPCFVVYPRKPVPYSRNVLKERMMTKDDGLAKLREDHPAYLRTREEAEELLSVWKVEKPEWFGS